MKKKLTKKDILVLAGLLAGSIAFMGFVHMTIQSQDTTQNNIIPPDAHPSNIQMPFCYHNGTCSTGPRDYSVP